MKLSLSNAWDEAKAVMASESRLLVAVALAFFVLPGIVLRLAVPDTRADQLPPPGPWMAIALAALLISLIGQVAISRMAMGPHISVGEAVQRGASRLVALFAAFLLWALPMLIAGTLLYSIASFSSTTSTGVALIALILLCLLTALAVYIVIRLVLIAPVAAAEDGNALALLKRSFEIARGNWWRLFAFVILFSMGAAVLLEAVESVMGLLAVSLLGDAGRLTVGGLLVAIVVQLVSAAVTVCFFVILARIYVQLAGRIPAGPSVPKSGI